MNIIFFFKNLFYNQKFVCSFIIKNKINLYFEKKKSISYLSFKTAQEIPILNKKSDDSLVIFENKPTLFESINTSRDWKTNV